MQVIWLLPFISLTTTAAQQLTSNSSVPTIVPQTTIFPGEGGCSDSTYNRCGHGLDFGAVCTPLDDGSHTCTCSADYELYSDGICKPVDPCRLGEIACTSSGDHAATCQEDSSSPNGFSCVCSPGSYSATNPDVGCHGDACISNPCNGGICEPQNWSPATHGFPYLCTNCPNTTVPFKGTCMDPCATAKCSNCTVDLTRKNGYECNCDAGQVFDGEDCVNPCSTAVFGRSGNTFCTRIDKSATCYPTARSPSYQDCNSSVGYKSIYMQEAHLKTSVDVDECTELTDPCGLDTQAVCTNTVGSYSCNCSSGFTSTSNKCIDNDECQTLPQPCGSDPEAKCTNTVGSYSCQCSSAYELVLGKCVLKGTCGSTPYPCGAADKASVCVDSPGSHTCTCSSQYKLYAGKCVPKDPCAEADPKNKNPCDDRGLRNTKCIAAANGTYTCQCPKGFAYNNATCRDINECLKLSNPCPGNSKCGPGMRMTCKNTWGGKQCKCRKPGVCDNGTTCTVIKVNDKMSTCDCPKRARWPYMYYIFSMYT